MPDSQASDAIQTQQNRNFFRVALLALLLGALFIGGMEWSHPEKDNVTFDIAILSFLTTIVTLFRVQETHILFNSRLTEYKEQVREIERSVGRDQERHRQEQKDSATISTVATAAAKVLETAVQVSQQQHEDAMQVSDTAATLTVDTVTVTADTVNVAAAKKGKPI